jgi:hypothetical protein
MVAATRSARAITDQSDSGRIATLLDDFNTAAWPFKRSRTGISNTGFALSVELAQGSVLASFAIARYM